MWGNPGHKPNDGMDALPSQKEKMRMNRPGPPSLRQGTSTVRLHPSPCARHAARTVGSHLPHDITASGKLREVEGTLYSRDCCFIHPAVRS